MTFSIIHLFFYFLSRTNRSIDVIVSCLFIYEYFRFLKKFLLTTDVFKQENY